MFVVDMCRDAFWELRTGLVVNQRAFHIRHSYNWRWCMCQQIRMMLTHWTPSQVLAIRTMIMADQLINTEVGCAIIDDWLYADVPKLLSNIGNYRFVSVRYSVEQWPTDNRIGLSLPDQLSYYWLVAYRYGRSSPTHDLMTALVYRSIGCLSVWVMLRFQRSDISVHLYIKWSYQACSTISVVGHAELGVTNGDQWWPMAQVFCNDHHNHGANDQRSVHCWK